MSDVTNSGRTNDEGAALIMALVFIGVVGLLISALLAQSSAQYRASTAFELRRDAIYAADAGVEHAIRNITATQAQAATMCASTIDDVSAAAAKDDDATVNLNGFNVGSADNRMLLVAVSHQGTVALDQVTAGGVQLTRIAHPPRVTRTAGSTSNTTELWYLLDGDMPSDTTPDIAVVAEADDDFAIHATSWSGVEQGPPALRTSTKADGDDDDISTQIDVAAAGSLVYSVAGTSSGDTDTTDDDGGSVGAGQATRLLGTSTNHAPSSASMGSSFAIRSAGAFTIEEQFDQDVNPATQMVIAAAPHSEPCPTSIALDNEDNDNGPSLDDFNIGAAEGYNRLLVVAVGLQEGDVTNVRLFVDNGPDTVEMTRAGQTATTNGQDFYTGLFFLHDEALRDSAGPVDISITANNDSQTNDWVLHASSWTGVSQTLNGTALPDAVATDDFGAVTSVPVSVPVGANDSLVISAIGHDNSSSGSNINVPSGFTELTRNQSGEPNSGKFATSYDITNGPTRAYNETWSTAPGGGAYVAAAFRPALSDLGADGLQCSQTTFNLSQPVNDYSVQVDCEPQGNPAQVVLITSRATKDGNTWRVRTEVRRDPSTGEVTTRSWEVG